MHNSMLNNFLVFYKNSIRSQERDQTLSIPVTVASSNLFIFEETANVIICALPYFHSDAHYVRIYN